MTRPYFTVDADIRHNRKMAALPSDSARYGWIAGVLGSAKTLRPAGRFDSRAHFLEVLGRFGRFLADYLRAGLMEQAPTFCERCAKRWDGTADGSLVVHDWGLHQRDPEAPERAREWRANAKRTNNERETNGERTPDERFPRARFSPLQSLSPVSSDSDEEGGPGETDIFDDDYAEHDALVWLAKHGCYVTPGNGYHRHLVTAVEHQGIGAIIRGFETLASAGVQDGDVKGFVFGVEDLLRTRPDLKALAEREADERFRREAERGSKRWAAMVKDFPA